MQWLLLLQSMGSRVQGQWLWLMGLVVPWPVGSSRPGIKPVSPALAGGFPTTGPPWKSYIFYIFLDIQLLHTIDDSIMYNITFICTGKPTDSYDSLFQWSGIELAISLKSACGPHDDPPKLSILIPLSGDLPDPGFKPMSPESPALAGGFLTTEPPGKTHLVIPLSEKKQRLSNRASRGPDRS